MPSSVKSSTTSSVPSKALYCLVSDASVSHNMRTKSWAVSESSSTRMGKRPCNSGIRSDGRDRWKAPEAMNKMRSEEHTSELQSLMSISYAVFCMKKKKKPKKHNDYQTT